MTANDLWSVTSRVNYVFYKLVPASCYGVFNQGKVEAELILMTAEEAEEQPAGKGRDEPDALPEPKYARGLIHFAFRKLPMYLCRFPNV